MTDENQSTTPAQGSVETAAALVHRFELESMALHKTQREWLVREIGAVLSAQPAAKCLSDLDRLAFELEEWIRHPDWAEDFSLADMAKWINERPTHIVPKLRVIAAVETATKSAPAVNAPQNNAERLPSSDAAEAGADTQLSAGTEAAVQLIEALNDIEISAYNAAKFRIGLAIAALTSTEPQEAPETAELRVESATLRECLQSIADMSDQEPREPDDADWRFRCLSAIEVARRVLAADKEGQVDRAAGLTDEQIRTCARISAAPGRDRPPTNTNWAAGGAVFTVARCSAHGAARRSTSASRTINGPLVCLSLNRGAGDDH